jgi:hypothetical protein
MVRVMVLNANLNNISVISWLSVLLVENTINLSQVTDKLYHIILSRVHIAWAGLELRTIVVICTDCIGRFKSNYHTTTTHDGLYISSSKYERKHGLCISMLECLIDITFWYVSTNDLHPRRNKPCPSSDRWLVWCDWFLVLNVTFSNISAISWWPVLVVEEAGVPGENHRPWASNW